MIFMGYIFDFNSMKEEHFKINFVCFGWEMSGLYTFEVWCVNWTQGETLLTFSTYYGNVSTIQLRFDFYGSSLLWITDFLKLIYSAGFVL